MGKINTNPGGAILLKIGKAFCRGGGGGLVVGYSQDFMDITLLFCLRLAPRIFDVLERIEWSGIKSYRAVFCCKDDNQDILNSSTSKELNIMHLIKCYFFP